jgi:hypothetical protein
MKTQRLAQLPWTETLSVDIVITTKRSKMSAHCPGFNQPAQARSNTVADSRATPYNAAPMAKQKKHPTGTIAQIKRRDTITSSNIGSRLVWSWPAGK